MIEVLRNKNLTTRFQILVEIANGGPNIQQRDIAAELEITPQAVSDYISRLIEDKLLISEGRYSYRVTNEGVNWIIKTLKELNSYNSFIQRAVTNISICTALAESDLQKNRRVGIKMKNGLLYASTDTDSSSTGITVSKARSGEDVGITNIEGIVPLQPGRVTIIRIPGIQRGGSRKADINRVKEYISNNQFTTFLGIEAYATIQKAGIEAQRFGAVAAAIEATRSGLNALVFCVENETSDLIGRLEKEGVRYELGNIESDSQPFPAS